MGTMQCLYFVPVAARHPQNTFTLSSAVVGILVLALGTMLDWGRRQAARRIALVIACIIIVFWVLIVLLFNSRYTRSLGDSLWGLQVALIFIGCV